MKTNGWIKYFLDGTQLEGRDLDVKSGKCSWSKSPLENIARCDLLHDGYKISLTGIGEYWQSDDLESTCSLNKKEMTTSFLTRRLQKKIEPQDGAYVFSQINAKSFSLEIVDLNKLLFQEPESSLRVKTINFIDKSDIGKWLLLEFKPKLGEISYRFNGDKI